MSNPNGPVVDDKPSARYLKIKMDPKGEINIGADGGTPQDYYVNVIHFTPLNNQPPCTNTPLKAAWVSASNEYIGQGNFNGQLTIATHAYDVMIQFVKKVGGSEPPETMQGAVIA